MLPPSSTPSLKLLVSKVSKPPAGGSSVFIASFKSDIKPEVDVSQNISNLETSGSVSNIARFFIVIKGVADVFTIPN